jgi:hypothetical protein
MKNLFKASGIIVALAILVALTLSLAEVSTVSAGKRAEVVEWSNGFPSGPHFNLNIHGKKPEYTCNPEPGGGSVFVPEYESEILNYDGSEIQIIQNKKSSITELMVIDKCAEAFDDDPIQVQLPKGHYQVYARILGKPGKDGEPRDVSFSPKLIDACNDTTVYDLDGDGDVDVDDLNLVDVNGDGVYDVSGDIDDEHDLNGDGIVDYGDVEMWTSTFGDLIECTDSSLIGLGIVTGNGAFTKDNEMLSRTTGKSKAVTVTDMFMYSGLIFDTSLDINGDGDLTLADLTTDMDEDGDIDDDDFALGIIELVEAELVIDAREVPMWIYDIADLVIYGWDYKNNGSKLVQIRFYPNDQTEYTVE